MTSRRPPEQPDDLEAALVERVTTEQVDDVVACWIESSSPFAAVVRRHEAAQFPEMPELMAPYENNAHLLALVDARPSTRRVVHVIRLSCATQVDGVWTGPPLVQDLVASGQGLDMDDVRAYLHQVGVEHGRCIAVESNLRVGDRSESPSGIPTADLAYLAIYNKWQELGGLPDRAVIFAHVNRPSLISFQRIGFEVRPACGLEHLRTPTVGGRFDDAYRPVEIPFSRLNARLFEELQPFAPVVIEVS